MGEEGKIRGATMEHLTSIAASLLFSNPESSALLAEKRRLFQLLRRVVRLALRLLFPLLSFLTTLPSPQLSSVASAAPATSAARALAHVLAVVSRIPVTSRKYDLIRSLADRLLDDNLRFGRALEAVNRAALSDAFSRTLRRLEAEAGSAPGDGSLDLVVGAVRSGLRRWTGEEKKGEAPAEKLAAELLWLAQKMEACGAAEEAVARWGDAAELARIALSAEARLQSAFVRLSVFLFKHANAGLVDEENDGEEDEECPTTRRGLAMLKSWLPLLCRARNGMDAPILSSSERAEMVRVLEEMIQKLSWDQQEEVLAIWLHHFTVCPDSDWPNLESCYSRWYAESRGLFLK